MQVSTHVISPFFLAKRCYREKNLRNLRPIFTLIIYD